MAEVSKLPLDGEPVGVNQIRNKINEIIDEGVGGGGNAVIDVGDVGVYSSNLSNRLFIEPAEGANYNGALRNVSGTYIPNAGTNRIDDFPVHQQKISDETGINHFAFILNGRLYTATGNSGHGNLASVRGDGPSDSQNPGLENIREHNLGGHYQHDTDVEVLDFYIGYAFSAVLMSDGTLWGWGRNNKGQLAQGNTTTYNDPVIIDTNVTRMWGPRGVQQHCGTWYDHGVLYWQNSQDIYYQVRCAGYNGQGQLADGTTVNTGTADKPFVISQWNHLNDYISYELKQVYNFTGVYGFTFIVLQHKTDNRVQQVIACGYNGYSNLGIDRYDSHTSAGPSGNPHYDQFPEILPTNTVNVTKWLWCLTAEGIPSWLPSWRCWHDSCAQEILGFYAGYHHSTTATTANINPWAVCWSRVWSGYGEIQGDFLRAAGRNVWGMLGCVDKALGTTSHENGENYKTFRYIPPDSNGYTWDEALANAPNLESGAKLAAPTTRAEWDRISVYIAETLSQPNSQDMHHGWLALVDNEAEGWWKNYHTNKQANRLYLPFSPVQPDDASGNQHFQGHAEYVYYNPQTYGIRAEDFTESRYEGSGETDGIRVDYGLNNTTNKMGRGVHDSICIGRGNTTDKNYVFIADTHCTSTTTPTLKTRIWKSDSTTSKVSFGDVIDENKFSVTNDHPSCYAQNGYKLHYVNPYIGKFVHIEDTGDLLYIAWHHDNNQLICARTHNLGSNWTYHYSTIPGAWGQRTSDEGFHVGGAGIHVDGGCTSAVYLGNGVVVAAFGGASTWSGLGVGENQSSQALLVRSYDYGKTWHIIGDADVAWTFSNLTTTGYYASHFTVGRYYDAVSNKFRLICSANSGGVVGNGNYITYPGFSWSTNTDVFAMAYSDDYGETWTWCEIDGKQINYDLMDASTWPNKDIFRGDMLHFIDQQSKVFIVRTHWEKAEEGNIHGVNRANWDVKTNAWCYVSGDGGRTFQSMPPGYLSNLTDYDAGIVQENGVYNKAGGDLNNTGVPVQGTYMGKSYRSVIKLEAYGTDGVVVFWGRNSDQEYQAPGYGASISLANIATESYKNLPLPINDPAFKDWLLSSTQVNQLQYSQGGSLSAYKHIMRSMSVSHDGTKIIIGSPYCKPTTSDDTMPLGMAWVFHYENGSWVNKAVFAPTAEEFGLSVGSAVYNLNLDSSQLDQYRREFRFGYSVAMSGDGSTLAIGAPGRVLSRYATEDGTLWGMIKVYTWNGSSWTLVDTLGGSGAFWERKLNGEELCISYDGKHIWSLSGDDHTPLPGDTTPWWDWPTRNTGQNSRWAYNSSTGGYTAVESYFSTLNTWMVGRMSASEDDKYAVFCGVKHEQPYNGALIRINDRLLRQNDDYYTYNDFIKLYDLVERGKAYYEASSDYRLPPGLTYDYVYQIVDQVIAGGGGPEVDVDLRFYNMPVKINESNCEWGIDMTTGARLLQAKFGSNAHIFDYGKMLLVGAPNYTMRQTAVTNAPATPSRLYDSNLEGQIVGAVYLLRFNPLWTGTSTTSSGTTDIPIGRWESVFSDGGPLYVGEKSNTFYTTTYPSADKSDVGEHPMRDWRNEDVVGWINSFDGVSNANGIFIAGCVGTSVKLFKYNGQNDVSLERSLLSSGDDNMGGDQHLYAGKANHVKLTQDATRIFVKAHVQDNKPLTQGYNINTANVGVYDTKFVLTDNAWQPEHRITAIYDIMNPEVVRNGPNVADYFMGPYHYSWANDSIYKQLFNQGSHLTGSYLPNGDLSFMQGGYGTLNSGYTLCGYAKKFPGTWIDFLDGENYAHIMAGSYVGYDGWRDLSPAEKVSGNNYIFQAGGALYPMLNDIGNPSTTRNWGEYNGSTRYFGYWIEKEYAAGGNDGTLTLGRDAANKNPCVSLAIPEINRFISPYTCSEYTNLVHDPVVQIRDIRQYASGPGGLIITLSNGNAWSVGYNSLGQRCAADYLNLGTTTTAYDFPTKIIYPNKQNNNQGWDNCLIAMNAWATYDHYSSIIMRDKEGSAWGWGYNYTGELGIGTDNTNYGPPAKIPLPKGVVPSVMGFAGAGDRGPVGIMITNDGRMFAAGYNGSNLVANGEGAVGNFRLYIPIRNPLA